MTACTRRAFGTGAALAGLSLAPLATRGQSKPRVVIIGGGIAGATVAKYLSLSMKGVDVTIVEPKTRFTTCVFGNLYLAGMQSLGSLTFGYDALTSRYGIKVVHDTAADVDAVRRRVRLASGTTLDYDRLVVAPGIAFEDVPGFDDAAAASMPDAWRDGSQAKLLRDQLEAMENGGVFVIVAPPDPCRCPQGPYERASLAAYFLKQFKPRSKVLILDMKASFAKQDLFLEGWSRHYPGMIEWLPVHSTGGLQAVDAKARSIKTANGTFKGNVVNVIPAQMAGEIAQKAGLVDRSRWCPVDPVTFESRLRPAIHVIGDSAVAGEMSKSAFAANSQGKACAFAVAAAFTGTRRAGTERGSALLFDAAFSHLAGDDVVCDAKRFEPRQGIIEIVDQTSSEIGESKVTRQRNAQQARGWYDAFMHDVFS